MTQYIITWLQNYKMSIYIALFVLTLLGSLLFHLGNKTKSLEADYLGAAHAFSKWQIAPEEDSTSLRNLKQLLQKHPELQPHYESHIAQSLLVQGLPQARFYAEKVLKRTNQSFFSAYAQTTLQINEKRYEKALEEALALKKAIKKNAPDLESSSLFAFNLMRIPLLYQCLNQEKEEMQAWETLKDYGGWDKENKQHADHKGSTILLHHFTEQDLSLLDYIKQRENFLQAKQNR